jgi:hypothetical protein
MTVLAVLVSPLWATILASSRPISAASRIALTAAYGGVAPHPHPEANSSTQQSGLAAPAGQALPGQMPSSQMPSSPASLGSLGAIMGSTGARPGAGTREHRHGTQPAHLSLPRPALACGASR